MECRIVETRENARLREAERKELRKARAEEARVQYEVSIAGRARPAFDELGREGIWDALDKFEQSGEVHPALRAVFGRHLSTPIVSALRETIKFRRGVSRELDAWAAENELI